MSSMFLEWGFNLFYIYSQIFVLYTYKRKKKGNPESSKEQWKGVCWVLEIIEDVFIVSWCTKRVRRYNLWELFAISQDCSWKGRRNWDPSGSPSKLSFVGEKSEVGHGTEIQGAKYPQVWAREWLHVFWKFRGDTLWWVGECGDI